MKSNFLKCTAIVLLMLFSQKLGLRLYMHAWLHIAKTTQAPGDSPADGQYHLVCDCLDEALMPLTVSHVAEVISPEKSITQIFIAKSAPLFSCFKIYKFLRGPPAV